MGAWGTGIFDDDLALDIKGYFEDALSEGLSIADATLKVLESYVYEIEDEDEGPVVYLALATLQLEKGTLQPEIREKALTIIKQGQGLQLWAEAGPELLAERKQVLAKLKASLSLEKNNEKKGD